MRTITFVYHITLFKDVPTLKCIRLDDSAEIADSGNESVQQGSSCLSR